jgi:hypothetical protein
MAFTNNPYATVQNVKDALGYASTNTASDAWIGTLLLQAQATLDQEIGYKFQTDGTIASPVTRTYSGNNKVSLFINDTISFSKVEEIVTNSFLSGSGFLWFQTTPSIIDITADVLMGPDNESPFYVMYRMSGVPFMPGKQNYRVTGVFGQPAIPPDINYCCTLIAVHNLKKRDTNYADVLVEASGSKQHFKKELTPDIVEIIELYKHRTFLSR